MSISEKYEQFKQHVKDHPVPYMAASFAGGVVLTCIVGQKIDISNVVSPVFNNMPVFNNENVVNLGGYTCKLVKCIETGQIWETVRDAAAFAGVDAVEMSRHINGHKDHIRELHYAIVGLGTVA